MAAASVPSTVALPGRGPALSTRRPGEAAASHRRRPRRAVPRSARRRARPRSARSARSAWLGREAALGSQPSGNLLPPRLRAQPAAGPGAPGAASALGAGVMTQRAGRQQRRRLRAGRGARGAAAAAGPLSCAPALGLHYAAARPPVRPRARRARSRPAEEAAGWSCGARRVRAPARHPPSAPQGEKREGGRLNRGASRSGGEEKEPPLPGAKSPES